MQIVHCDLMLFHHPQGGILIFLFDRCSDSNLPIEPVPHRFLRLWTRRCCRGPNQLGPCLLQAGHQQLKSLFIPCWRAVFVEILPAIHVPESPVEMDDVPLSIAQPLVDLFQAPAGVLSVLGIQADLGFAS